MPYAARELTAALLPNGYIHIAGGANSSGTFQSLSYWYDPYENTWTAKNNLPIAWIDGRVGSLPDGRILISGGSANGSGNRITTTYIYDPSSDTYTLASPLLVAVGNHVGATLADGRIISIAGVPNGNTPDSLITQIFDPNTMSWTLAAPQLAPHGNYPGMVATPCGAVYLWGGSPAPDTALRGTKTVEAYDPSTDTWSVLPDLPFFASDGSYGRFYDGQYIWASGHDNTAMTAKTYLSTDPVGD